MGIIVGFDVALLIIMGIEKWKERKSRKESERATAVWGKINSLTGEELDKFFEQHIEDLKNMKVVDSSLY